MTETKLIVKERWLAEGGLAEMYHIGDLLVFISDNGHDHFHLDDSITYDEAVRDAYKVVPFDIDLVPKNASGSPFL